jgi:hypothetical protein
MLSMRAIARYSFPAIIATVAGATIAVAANAPPASINKQQLTQAQSETPSAVWVTKVSSFVYQGLTSKYTCNALEAQIKEVLQVLGASKSDLSVRTIGCPDPLTPSYYPGANIKMTVLQPAEKTTPKTLIVPARWKTVDLKLNRGSKNESGQCELIEAIARSIVPLFTTRNLKTQTTCVPNTASATEPTLKVDVLTAEEPRPNS